jgi:hypothetical protein
MLAKIYRTCDTVSRCSTALTQHMSGVKGCTVVFISRRGRFSSAAQETPCVGGMRFDATRGMRGTRTESGM